MSAINFSLQQHKMAIVQSASAGAGCVLEHQAHNSLEFSFVKPILVRERVAGNVGKAWSKGTTQCSYKLLY